MSNQSIATPVASVINISSIEKPQFDAAITSKQIDIIEKTLAGHHRTRRLMLYFLSLDSKSFIEKSEALVNDNEDLYIEAIEAMDDYHEKLESLFGLAKSAFARLLLVGEYISKGN